MSQAKQEGSQPIYGVRVEKDVRVKMRDGVNMAVDIFRPDAEGKFPALVALSPYGKEIQLLPLPSQPRGGTSLCDGCIEAGDMEYIVSRGYAHIIGDLRGTGDSEGEYCGVHSKAEGEDSYDLIEWIAQQPWCNGNVGMIGISYYGMIQLIAAVEQPPHLKAICPWLISTDVYRDIAYHGGVLFAFWEKLWDGDFGNSGYAPRNVTSAMVKNLPKEELDKLVEEAINNPDIRNYGNYYQLVKYPKKNPLFFDFLVNPNDGPFYWERSIYTQYDKIKIPVYTGTNWGSRLSMHATFDLYENLTSPKKVLMVPPDGYTRPWRSYHDTILRWCDYWLKGIDTGIMDEPPIKLFIQGAGKWRYENEWPLARTEWTKYYLRGWEGLSPEPEKWNDEPDCFLQEPLYVTYRRGSLKYLTPPLPEDTELTGPVALYMYAAINTDDTNWRIELKEVDPSGSESKVPLSSGWLKASHRAVDESKSKPWDPFHPHLKPEVVEPGKIYEYAIGLSPMCKVFKAGHRIKLEIASIDSPREPGAPRTDQFHLPSSRTTLHKIYRDTEHMSYLLLPIIPKDGGG